MQAELTSSLRRQAGWQSERQMLHILSELGAESKLDLIQNSTWKPKVIAMKLLTGQAPRYRKDRPDKNGGVGRRYSNKSNCCVCIWRYSLCRPCPAM